MVVAIAFAVAGGILLGLYIKGREVQRRERREFLDLVARAYEPVERYQHGNR